MSVQDVVATSRQPLRALEAPVGAMPSGIMPTSMPPVSNYRRVFQTTDQMQQEFVKFLKTIFYQLDEKKVLEGMETILADPTKTDEQIYTDLLSKIDGMKKRGAPLWQIYSLGVLKKGLGDQVAKLLKPFQPSAFNDYMEIYDRRYLNTVRKVTGFPLQGDTVAVSDRSTVSVVDRLQAGALISSYPYKRHVALNDPGCISPEESPEQTCKPIGDEVADNSMDLVTHLGGLHHIPKERLEPFVSSLSRKLRPGGVFLVRDHNVRDNAGKAQLPQDDLRAMVSIVHTFVNAAGGTPWSVESGEIREFKSLRQWVEILERHEFKCVSEKHLVLKDDPTENGMIALVKQPQNLEEMQQAIQYRDDCSRGKDGTRATWIEWGNVRSSKQYAKFVQTHHSYAFDYIGHLRQHWSHFYNYIQESLHDDVKLKDLVFSGNFAMNLFILCSVAAQSVSGYVTSLPSMAISRWQHGENWREVSNLTEIEKYTASVEKEYSDFIDHTPFYSFDYIGKIKGVWQAAARSEGVFAKALSIPSALFWSIGMAAQAAISAPVRAIYTHEGNMEPDTVKVLIKDPDDELAQVINQWEAEKDPVYDEHNTIEEVYTTPDGYKLISVPRYRSFTQICGYISDTSNLEVLEIGGEKGISVDVLLDANTTLPEVQGARVVYKMDKLQDAQHRCYATYHVATAALKEFVANSPGTIEYIHE